MLLQIDNSEITVGMVLIDISTKVGRQIKSLNHSVSSGVSYIEIEFINNETQNIKYDSKSTIYIDKIDIQKDN